MHTIQRFEHPFIEPGSVYGSCACPTVRPRYRDGHVPGQAHMLRPLLDGRQTWAISLDLSRESALCDRAMSIEEDWMMR